MTKRRVTVVGTARISLPTDAVSVNVGVEVYEATPTSGLTGVAAGLGRMTGVLRAGGVADQAIMTTEVVVRPHWDHGLPPEPYTRLWGSGGLIVWLTIEQAQGGVLHDLLDSPEARLHSLVLGALDRGQGVRTRVGAGVHGRPCQSGASGRVERGTAWGCPGGDGERRRGTRRSPRDGGLVGTGALAWWGAHRRWAA